MTLCASTSVFIRVRAISLMNRPLSASASSSGLSSARRKESNIVGKFHYLEVTHAALERALLKLDFKVSSCETHRLYENKEHGTLLMMPPCISMERQVRPALLSSARHTVAAYRVADRAALERPPTEEAPTE